MKRSTCITLVLSGTLSSSLLNGCDAGSPSLEAEDGPVLTNNTYQTGRGYWHAPYHAWYPHPYNDYQPGLGYYHGGSYSPSPELSSIQASRPISGVGSASASRFSTVSRGGFGQSAMAHSSGG
jgi:hypothetical protein